MLVDNLIISCLWYKFLIIVVVKFVLFLWNLVYCSSGRFFSILYIVQIPLISLAKIVYIVCSNGSIFCCNSHSALELP